MKVGVFLALFANQPLTTALEYVASVGVQAVEIGTGGYPGDHLDRRGLLKDAGRQKALRRQLADLNLELAAFSCHGNPLHPDQAVREEFETAFRETLDLANAMEVPTVITFSGCPGDSDQARYPNWVTCPWPEDFLKVLEWQWQEKVLPYWTQTAQRIQAKGLRVALEMHPGFVVYNPETLKRLREAAGPPIGANLDPSHFFWQGIDPVAAVRDLGDSIYHFHAKDTQINPYTTGVNGVLDTKHYSDERARSWIFRTVGYGHGANVWRDIISALRVEGYDGVLSIEHEDSLMSAGEGFQKAVHLLNELAVKEPKATMWWA